MRPDQIQPELYEQQLDEKVDALKALMAEFSMPELNVYKSAETHYRMRAEFRVWHDGDDMYYAMFDSKDPRTPIRVDQFPVASKLINELMPALLEAVRHVPILRHKLFQVDFLTTQTGEALISLLYHKPIDDEWEDAAKELNKSFPACHFIGRSRKKKKVLTRDFVMETLTVNGQKYHYQQVENSFTQPNAGISEKMLEWAMDVTQGCSGDLLEMYCGNGNFSIPLARRFDQVIGTEIAKVSVNSASLNIAMNGMKNVQVVKMASEDVSAALNGEGELPKALVQAGMANLSPSVVLVDPPRAGLDDATVELVRKVDKILYISCNPETLKNNMQALSSTHDVTRFALFDQFPYTHHVEAGVFLERR
ncbi:tRNA (uridine(54)-C5)-methyltransferase TrmA [Marinomonas mediterranea]|jgi:tRNA (uracil-5-)-methyltransferase (EC 2.1.1.35)|uniref:tRNA/tmRNA (uracil-C(5))-methyltransferase n=1 Tax=Marinomonas mediterranea (strain ATCC 700492 / JCM 21426 / NBRC 103028 / MMB-1) TaxID=717774 RepID=F2JZD0_MARM1|nr:tRNA (uridine(54)-C5)-methyltransferase TrmA [Marinomonas mediterranea]ADZ93215.1 tRNA (uracil-5-)-methyltransferase [Marinomonas mediterranea MMB-1]WCN19211.1 tRNA (uridine(54)-C5)-methyltransferase TrmA [Marinomonas mediterranea MMB-1]